MAEPIIPVGRMLAVTAKVLCSAVHISGRCPEETYANSAPSALHALQLPDVLRETAIWSLDREAQRVDISIRMDGDIAARMVAAYRAVLPDFSADWTTETARWKAGRWANRSCPR